eukprot:scaffold288997_cov24-Tisochrysis_lutea.AAC.1
MGALALLAGALAFSSPYVHPKRSWTCCTRPAQARSAVSLLAQRAAAICGCGTPAGWPEALRATSQQQVLERKG